MLPICYHPPPQKKFFSSGLDEGDQSDEPLNKVPPAILPFFFMEEKTHAFLRNSQMPKSEQALAKSLPMQIKPTNPTEPPPNQKTTNHKTPSVSNQRIQAKPTEAKEEMLFPAQQYQCQTIEAKQNPGPM